MVSFSSSREGFIAGFTFALALAAALAVRVFTIDPSFETRTERQDTTNRVSAPPSAQKVLSLEHPLAAADAIWLSLVQEYGKAIEGEQPNDDRILLWTDAITNLDPKYLTVYYTVGVNLTVYSRRSEDSDRILAKGRAALPDAWQLPFMMGYNAYFLRGDPEPASRLWAHAATLPKAPAFLLSLAARARYQTGDEQGAEQMLVSMMPFLSGPAREDAKLRLQAFRSEPILQEYDRACEAYLAEHGERPESGAVLHQAGLAKSPPYDLFDQPITLDEDCRARTKYITVREDEAKDYIGQHEAPSYLDVVRGAQ